MSVTNSTLFGAISAATGLTLVAIPLVSMAYLISQQSSWSALSDFGVDCDPPALLLTFAYVIITVPLQITIGTITALAVYLCCRERRILLVATISTLTVPYAIPSTIGLTLWEFGLGSGGTLQSWFFESGSPMDGTLSRFLVLVALSVWQFSPFVFLLTLAAFLAIPKPIISAAEADGASYFRLAVDFLIPIALPVIVAAALLRSILMITKLDTPLAFDLTSSSDFACLASVQIYSSLGLAGDLIPLGLVSVLSGTVLCLLVAYAFVNSRLDV